MVREYQDRDGVWRKDTYQGIHDRVRAARGAATEHACVTCGAGAVHWAYDHRDRREMKAPNGSRHSGSIKHYWPMCSQCHGRFDAAVARARVAARKRMLPTVEHGPQRAPAA